MKLLADESVDGPIVARLRSDGHDIKSITEESSGVRDEVVLARARELAAVLLTADKDFGELAFRVGLPAPFWGRPDADNKRVLEAINSRTDWVGHFSVITEDRIRVRSLPTDTAPQ